MLDVTVIIPFYSSIENLERALNSISNQLCTPNNVIIVDDFSSHYYKVLMLTKKTYPFRLLVLRNEKNLGPAAARNLGIRNSHTKYISFLDEDDTWHPKKLYVQHSFMELQGLSISATQRSDSEAHFANLDSDVYYTKKLNFWSTILKNRITTSSIMMDKDLYKVYLFREEFRYSEDYELWLRILKAQPIYLIKLPLAVRYKSQDNTNLSSNLNKMYQGELRSVELHINNGLVRTLLKFYIFLKLVKRYYNKIIEYKRLKI